MISLFKSVVVMDELTNHHPTYVRLSRERRDRRLHIETGIFHTAGRLQDRNETSYADEALLRSLLRWFGKTLPAPRSLNSVHSIFWFKPHVESRDPELWRKIVELRKLLNAYGYPVRFLYSRRPGYIVYEDDYQIAAVPFRDTFAEVDQ